MRNLYPQIIPYSSGFLSVDEIHSLYWEQSGNPDGVPILLVHGGPGGGTTPTHRQFFDPDFYRIILFDQRGCGKSSPHGSLENNTPQALVQDIEKIRLHLKIDRWHLFGSSWGTTLSLLYAIDHPDHCLSLVLQGVFLLSPSEIEWFLYGSRHFFPEAWAKFSGHVGHSQNLLDTYYLKLTSQPVSAQIEAGQQWCAYEYACSALNISGKKHSAEEMRWHDWALARIEAHYFKHHALDSKNNLLNKVNLIRHIPATIIQGRYDTVCPMHSAYDLHLAWPEADFIIVGDGGHSTLDPPITSRLIEATDNARHIRI